jgi:hypothetical protein
MDPRSSMQYQTLSILLSGSSDSHPIPTTGVGGARVGARPPDSSQSIQPTQTVGTGSMNSSGNRSVSG